MRLRSGSQRGHERSGGIRIHMRIHPGRGASPHTCCVAQRTRSPAGGTAPRPAFLPPSLPWLQQTSEQKRGLSLPSASILMSGPRRRQRALPFHLSLVPLGTALRGQSSLPSDKKDLRWDFRSDHSQSQSMAFSFFRPLSSKLLGPFTLKVPKYL